MPDSLQGEASFGVDHYRPKSVFPSLATEYSNLFYCCNACNRNKGNFWPDEDEAAERFVPNPVAHRMFSHLRYKGAHVEHASVAGEFAVELLDLNDPVAVEFREDVIHTIDVLEKDLQELDKAGKAARKQRDAGTIAELEANEMLKEIAALRNKTLKALDRFSGEYS